MSVSNRQTNRQSIGAANYFYISVIFQWDINNGISWFEQRRVRERKSRGQSSCAWAYQFTSVDGKERNWACNGKWTSNENSLSLIWFVAFFSFFQLEFFFCFASLLLPVLTLLLLLLCVDSRLSRWFFSFRLIFCVMAFDDSCVLLHTFKSPRLDLTFHFDVSQPHALLRCLLLDSFFCPLPLSTVPSVRYFGMRVYDCRRFGFNRKIFTIYYRKLARFQRVEVECWIIKIDKNAQ